MYESWTRALISSFLRGLRTSHLSKVSLLHFTSRICSTGSLPIRLLVSDFIYKENLSEVCVVIHWVEKKMENQQANRTYFTFCHGIHIPVLWQGAEAETLHWEEILHFLPHPLRRYGL